MGDALSIQGSAVGRWEPVTTDKDGTRGATLPPRPQSSGLVETFVARRKTGFSDAKELVPDLNNASLQMFADQESMQRSLNRIAVFVESSRKGEVLSDEELRNHYANGNNKPYIGHDYQARDLASFFNTANKNGIKLNEAEEKLRSELLSQGIITQNSSTKLDEAPVGNRTYIATSYEQGDRKTAITLNHELIHARFFTDEKFAHKCRQYFNALPPNLQSQVKETLSRLGYNKNDQDLMINEFTAHMLVENTFLKHDTADGASRPGRDPRVAALFEKLSKFNGFLPREQLETERSKLRSALSGYNLPEYLEPYAKIESSS